MLGILSTPNVSSTTKGQETGLEVIKRWDFGSNDDLKGAGWPDRWTRRTGVEYPKYLEIKISKAANSEEERREIDRWRRIYAQLKLGWERKSLPWTITPERTPPELDQLLESTILNPFVEFVMDGGKAEISSPFLIIEPDSVYGINCGIFAECDSRNYEALAVLRICDAQKNVLFEQTTSAVDHSQGWITVSADSQYPYSPSAQYAQVALLVNPKRPDAFRGRFRFDSVNVTRAPRLSLNVDKASGIYRVGESIKAECTAIGMATLQNHVELLLINHDGTTVARSVRQLERESTSKPQSPVLITTSVTEPAVSNKPFWSGRTSWTLPELEPGYYEIHTQLQRSARRNSTLKRQIVVLPRDANYPINGQLGWAIKDDTRPYEALETDLLVEVLREAGMGKLKIPIWTNSREPVQMDNLLSRIDRVQNAGITCVGVIASPPPALRSLFSQARGAGTGGFLEDWTVAQAFLEPIIRETTIRIMQYQLGWDDEPDFVVNPRIRTAVESLNRLLRRYSQESQLISTNNPLNKRPTSDVIDRWQMAIQVPFTAEELKRSLLSSTGNSTQNNLPWFHITPLPPDTYSLSTRTQDLAERILVLTDPQLQSKTIGWVFDPSSNEAQVYGAELGPGVMFSPLRTLARATAGMQTIGSFPATMMGTNYILSSGDDCRVIAWNPEVIRAELFLGKNARAYDVWGRNIPVEKLDSTRHNLQRVAIGPNPIIIDQIDLKAVRWFLGAEILTEKIDVVVGRIETVEVKFENDLPSIANGTVKLICDAFEQGDEAVSFQIPELGTQKISIPVRLRPEANVGITPIQAVFQVDDTPVVINDQILIGNDDFDFSLRYEFTNDNQLIVEIEAINKTEIATNFDCIIRIPGRRAERRQILDLTSKARRTIVFTDADQLVGKVIRLHCEQEGINRIINKQIRIESPGTSPGH